MKQVDDVAKFVLERRPGWNPKPTTAKEFSGAHEALLEVIQGPVRGFRLRRLSALRHDLSQNPKKFKAAKKSLADFDFRENDNIEAPAGTKRRKVRRLLRQAEPRLNSVFDAALAATPKRKPRKKAKR